MVEKAKIDHEDQKTKREISCRDDNQSILKREVNIDSSAVNDFPYFSKKKIENTYCGKFIDINGNICFAIPMKDEHGVVWNFQYIDIDGIKLFSSGRAKGLFNEIFVDDEICYVCEGFATAVSIHKATGKTVVIAFSAGNIPFVTGIAVKKYKKTIICADNDAWGEKNTGMKAAKFVSDLYKLEYRFPTFKDNSTKPTDFNDLEIIEGIDAVKSAIQENPMSATMDDVIANFKGFYDFFYDDKTGKTFETPDYIGMSNALKTENVIKCSNSATYVYNDGYWRYVDSVGLDNIIFRLTNNHCKPNHFENFKKTIKANCFHDIENHHGKNEEMMINLKNGVVSLRDGALYPHSSKYFFKQIIPIEYDPTKGCPEWIRFLRFVFNNDDDLISFAQEIFGYVLVGGAPFLHKAFVLQGSGRNGKSTFLDILKQLLGEESYSTVSMAKLHKEFSAVRLIGKLANIVEETPDDEINSEIFKTMVGGGTVQVSYKGKDEFSSKINARFIFACNDMPIFKDKNVSMLDRLVFIPFGIYIPEKDRDTKIGEKLSAELPGILNWAIEGAKKIAKTRSINAPASCVNLKEEYREETDPLHSWFKEHIEPGVGVYANDLYISYKNDMEKNGNHPFSAPKFFKRFIKMCKMDSNLTGFVTEKKDKSDGKKTVRNLSFYNAIAYR
jgi:P4 family phage/plasmid primase-like protien